MEKDLISIVIPVYNVEKYLDRCLKSVLEQTYSNLEIILVNDCSTDNSRDVCHKYKKRDARIRTIDLKTNQGPGMARNEGIKIATGKYIMFIDADDFVSRNYVSELYTLLLESKSDVAVCLGRPVYDLKKIRKIENDRLDNYEVMTDEKAIENICYQRKITPGPLAKIFKIELFDGIRFPDTGYEDLAVIYKLFAKSKRIAFAPIEKYYYVQRRNNTTLGAFNSKKMDRIKVAIDLKKFVDSRYKNLTRATSARCFLAGVQTLNVLPFDLLKSEYGVVVEACIRTYRKDVICDKSAKTITRIMAFMSCFGMWSLKLMGSVYNISQGVSKVKLK